LDIKEVRYIQNPDFIYRKIVEEMVLIPIHQDVADYDCIFSLNLLGSFIWEQLNIPRTNPEVMQLIIAEFDADQQTIQADLGDFLRDLLSIGAIKEVH